MSVIAANILVDQLLGPDVQAFCQRHGIVRFVGEAVRLADGLFSPIQGPAVVLDVDGETGEERVVIEVVVDTTPDETGRRYDDYLLQWIAVAPPEARYWVSLSLNVRGGHEPA